MTTKDTRFDPFPDAGQWAVTFPIARRESDLETLYARWQQDLMLLQTQAGRRLSREELKTAVPQCEI